MASCGLSPLANLSGSISKVSSLSGSLSVGGSDNGGGTIAGSKYPGTDVYDITPKVNEAQEFNTKNKILEGNVIVREIPFSAVSNTSGGTTVYIGKVG